MFGDSRVSPSQFVAASGRAGACSHPGQPPAPSVAVGESLCRQELQSGLCCGVGYCPSLAGGVVVWGSSRPPEGFASPGGAGHILFGH